MKGIKIMNNGSCDIYLAELTYSKLRVLIYDDKEKKLTKFKFYENGKCLSISVISHGKTYDYDIFKEIYEYLNKGYNFEYLNDKFREHILSSSTYDYDSSDYNIKWFIDKVKGCNND